MSGLRYLFLLLALLLPACAGGKAAGPLRTVRLVNADGSLSAPLAENDLTEFQKLLRSRLAAVGPVTGALALEADVPEGTGTEGGYLALVQRSAGEELQYVEQSDHRPRTDRYFHRMLTSEETAELDGFMAAHPLATLQVFSPMPVVPVDSATEPAGATTLPEEESAVVAATRPVAATEPDVPLIAGQEGNDEAAQFRFTEVHQNEARMVTVQSPGMNDHPVIDLLLLLGRIRNAAPFACTYLRSMPLTAKSLYADPTRKVLWVWTGGGGDLRIAVSGPVSAAGQESEQWLACHQGQWEPSVEPGSDPVAGPTTEASTEPATPATQPVTLAAPTLAELFPTRPTAATLPSAAAIVREWRLNHTEMLPREETWWTVASTHATTVFHYVPLSSTHGVTHGFVVPGLEFDDEHFAVDLPRGVMYLIHDGQLFSLVLPEGAR